MATLTSAAAAATVQARTPVSGVTTKTASYTASAAVATADVIQMVKVPLGAIIVDVTLAVDDMDTGAALLVTVGDGGDADRFITSSNIGQAGGVARLNAAAGLGYTYVAEDTIDVTIATGPAGGGTGTVRLAVTYTLD